MGRRIAFTDVDVSNEGVVACAVHRDGEAQELWFRLPYAFTPAPDLLAAVFAGLCGAVFDEVQIDLPIGPRLSAAIEEMTGARVEHAPGTDRSREPGTAQALNFSGGFDSLAARLIMPEAHLVSLDFGGRFARERPVYSRFPTHIVETNLVDLGLNLHGTEAFMSSAGILLRDELDLAVLGSGDIQASSLPAAFTGPVPQRTTPVAEVLGLGPASPVAGVSEAGTMLVCARRRPELLLDVLASVAHRGEVKYHRKRLLLEAVAQRAGLDLALPDLPVLGQPRRWGAVFADDLAALYVLRVLGPEAASLLYNEEGIPGPVLERIPATSLAFMERFNPQAYAGLPPELLGEWYARLLRLGVPPYERQDWFDAATAMKAVRNQL